MDAELDAAMREYLVVMRAPSAVQFRRDEGMAFGVMLPPWGRVEFQLRTRYLDRGVGATLPGNLWIQARGPAPSLKEAVTSFANLALYYTPILAISANAAIATLDVELAYDATPGAKERDFFQNYIPPEPPVPDHLGRIIEPTPTLALIEAVHNHPETARIHRAIGQYQLALDHWRFGEELLAVEFLYMGMEALVPAMVETGCRRSGMSEQQLAASLNVRPKPEARASQCPTCQERAQVQWRYEFLGAVRRSLLFQGDAAVGKAAREASDGFEHGYRDFGEARDFAHKARNASARYLREAILKLLDLDELTRSQLLDARFNMPLGPHRVVSYIWGTLLSESDALAADGQAYPAMQWRLGVEAASVTPTGGTTVKLTQTHTASLAPGVQFKPSRIEGWDPNELL